MIPKKASDLYKEVSETCEVSESLVENLIEFFYKDLRDNLTNLKHPRINVLGLGHFKIKSKTVELHIERYTKILQNHDTSTIKAYFNKKMLEEKLVLLERVYNLIQEEHQKKTKFLKDNGKIN